MKFLRNFIGALFIIFGLVLIFCTFVVEPNEYAVTRRFGKIVNITDEQGLHMKIPFFDGVTTISKKVCFYDIPPSNVITSDKKTMISDLFVIWRVENPTLYIQTLNMNESRAQERIEANVYNAIKTVISSMNQEDVMLHRNDNLSSIITKKANSDIGAYGIRILQAEIKALDLPDDNKSSVYERMISERQNIAASFTAAGEFEAQKIINSTNYEVSLKLSEANKNANVEIALGEAKYMKVLQDAYNTPEKSEFYNFMRSLDALRKSLSGENKTIILDKDSDITKILYGN